MNERPVHFDYIKGKSLNEKLTNAFKEGFTHVIKFSTDIRESMYFARSVPGAIACKSNLQSMVGVRNVVIIPLEG